MIIKAGCPPCHWVIEPAVKATSKGQCIKCGTEKEFKNSSEVSLAWRNKAAAEELGLLKDY